MKLRPLNKRVLIKKPEKTKELKSGIILPDSSGMENNQKGEVISISKEIENVKEGDSVIYNKYNGTEVEIDDVEYVILEEKDLLGIIEE